ncbi:putative bifunctional diguanylate cyclase/phosphodiesterase [Rhodococcoides yunnanense]|uniref:putative bifunctional diguanylate cyclase/phosphodiesterase n=1 Tax=Rhodococcoides yunnanense TaxID=278209 RepID=UPI0009FBEDC9|nr:bifunctional diguanylate cyclase/phosphodiesterase [Rhodococcus yunnanensis]
MAWSRFLIVGFAGVAGYLLLPDGSARVVVYLLVACVSLAAYLARGRARSPRNAVTSMLLAAGFVACFAGDVVVGIRQIGGHPSPVVSPVDALFLLGHAAFIAAVFAGHDGKGRIVRIEDALEAMIVATGVGLVSWIFVIGHHADVSLGSGVFLHNWTAVLYITGDGFLVALTLIVWLTNRHRTAPFIMLVAAFCSFATAGWFTYAGVVGTEVERSVVAHALWLCGYVLLASSALHPAPNLSPKTSEGIELFSDRTRLFGLSAAILMAPIVMGVELARGVAVSEWGWVVMCASMLVVVLVAARMACFLAVMRRQAVLLTSVAMSDSVTGLANRRRIGELLDRALAESGDEGILVLIVDIDRFAHINETFGYPVGDSVLREIGERLVAATVTDAVVGRLGGDQFVVAIPVERMPLTPVECAEHFQRSVSRTMFVRDINVSLEATVGVVQSSKLPAVDAGALLQHAHVALTAAKAGHTRVSIYAPSMDSDRHEQMRLLGELETAVLQRQLRVHFQPCLDLRTGRVTGVEALLRWQHPREGLIAPSSFLPDAEQTGMLPAITAYVLEDALACCSALRRRGVMISVSVNLSVRNLVDPTLVEQVEAALQRHDVPSSAVEFEVTETSAMTDPRRSVDSLIALRDIGASIAVDDYGTGYSSLAYLRSLPVQTLKIDKSFVTAMTDQPTNAAIVRSTIELGRSLGMSVVAEGVEDEETLDRLRVLGCNGAQGFHIGRPVPAEELEALIERIEIDSRTEILGSAAPWR